MFYTVFDVLKKILSWPAVIAWEIEIFHPEKTPLFVKDYIFHRITANFALSGHTRYLHEELIPLVLFSQLTKQEENKMNSTDNQT